MTTSLQIFESPEFGKVTTAVIDGKEYFAATECAKILGYANPQEAVRTHCKGVREFLTPTKGGEQNVNFIPEGDLYRLIVRSNLPATEKFERWVFEEILPSIRKHGAYLTPDTIEKVLSDPDTIIRIATELKAERQARLTAEAQIEADKPKTVFADAVSTSHTEILIGELAKILRQNGVEIGQKRLFEWLRDKGYLCKYGSSYNCPTQRSMELGLFRIKETAITHSDGHVTIQRTPKVTGKGQIYLVNKFISKKPLSPEVGGPVLVADELGNDRWVE